MCAGYYRQTTFGVVAILTPRPMAGQQHRVAAEIDKRSISRLGFHGDSVPEACQIAG